MAINVDLSDIAGTETMQIVVTTSSSTGSLRVVWKDLRIEGQVG